MYQGFAVRGFNIFNLKIINSVPMGGGQSFSINNCYSVYQLKPILMKVELLEKHRDAKKLDKSHGPFN